MPKFSAYHTKWRQQRISPKGWLVNISSKINKVTRLKTHVSMISKGLIGKCCLGASLTLGSDLKPTIVWFGFEYQAQDRTHDLKDQATLKHPHKKQTQLLLCSKFLLQEAISNHPYNHEVPLAQLTEILVPITILVLRLSHC
jgi:hypothetical protein